MIFVKKNLLLLFKEKIEDRNYLRPFPILWPDRLSYNDSLFVYQKSRRNPFYFKKVRVSHLGSIKTGRYRVVSQ
jgi:hypothetical protein